MQIKTIERYHSTPTRLAKKLSLMILSTGESTEKWEHLPTADRSVSQYNRFGKRFGCYLVSGDIHALQFSNCTNKHIVWKNSTCAPVYWQRAFIALSVTVPNWNDSRVHQQQNGYTIANEEMLYRDDNKQTAAASKIMDESHKHKIQ